MPQLYASGLDNDHLGVFDHWLQLFAGKLNVLEWVFARIPSFFPDYWISGILTSITGGQAPEEYLAIYFMAKYLLMCSAAFLLICVCLKNFQSAMTAALTLSLLIVISDKLFEGFGISLAMAGLPANHGGNLINVLFGISIIVNTSSNRSKNKFFACSFLLLGLLAGFSNRLFLIQLVLPGIIFIYRNKIREKSLSLLMASSVAGATVPYLFIIHQCASAGDRSTNLNLQAGLDGLEMLLRSGSLLILFLGLITSLFLKNFPSSILAEKYFHRLNINIIMFSLLAFMFLVPDSQVVYNRYLLAPIFTSLISTAFFLAGLISKSLYIVVSAWIGFAFLVLNSTPFHLKTHSLSSRLKPQYDWAVKEISRFNEDEIVVLSVSPPWESRLLAFKLKRPGSVLAVSTDGNPMLWPHSREEYLENKSSRYDPLGEHIRTFKYYLGSNSQQEIIKQRLQLVEPPISCFSDQYCLWKVSDELNKSQRTSFLQSFFRNQADDKWRCLNRRLHPIKKLFVTD